MACIRCGHTAEKKRKEKTTPFGVNLTRRLVIYQAAQNTAENKCDSLACLASRVCRGKTDLGVQEAACGAVPYHGLHAVCACQPLNGLSQKHAIMGLQEDVHFKLLHGTRRYSTAASCHGRASSKTDVGLQHVVSMTA